jgi:hypothetical protein
MASWLGMHPLENKLDMASATTPFLAVSDERHPLQYPLHVLQMSFIPYILDDSTHPYIHWRSGQACFFSCHHTQAIMKHPHQQHLNPHFHSYNQNETKLSGPPTILMQPPPETSCIA